MEAQRSYDEGATTTDVKQFETRRVIYDGASEVDMVINVGALKSGDLGVVERDIAAEQCFNIGDRRLGIFDSVMEPSCPSDYTPIFSFYKINVFFNK